VTIPRATQRAVEKLRRARGASRSSEKFGRLARRPEPRFWRSRWHACSLTSSRTIPVAELETLYEISSTVALLGWIVTWPRRSFSRVRRRESSELFEEHDALFQRPRRSPRRPGIDRDLCLSDVGPLLGCLASRSRTTRPERDRSELRSSDSRYRDDLALSVARWVSGATLGTSTSCVNLCRLLLNSGPSNNRTH